eukprot:1149413-Pelagomonas_calceolata.AAC.5
MPGWGDMGCCSQLLMGFQPRSPACLTAGSNSRGSRMGPVQQGLAVGAGCQAACPGGPEMERWKKGMSRNSRTSA